MPTFEFVNQCEVDEGYITAKIASAFDLDRTSGQSVTIAGELPDDDDWQIGLIVGPSGSGKSSVARHFYPNSIIDGFEWSPNKAMIEDLGKNTKKSTSALNRVGLNSVPSWLRPFRYLSNGEQFRATLARALLESSSPIVFDEFTSVVDRTVAKIGCAAISKAIRKTEKKFIGVACHYDIIEWMEPDWVLDMQTGHLSRRRLRRPDIKLRIVQCDRSLWSLFRHHHYLNTGRVPGGRYFCATINDNPVAWCSGSPVIGAKNVWRLARLVVLPDYQGVGIGSTIAKRVGRYFVDDGKRFRITTSHPAVIGGFKRSDDWKCVAFQRVGAGKHGGLQHDAATSSGRSVATFEFKK